MRCEGRAASPPEVLQLVTRMNIGGPGRALIELARGLQPDYRVVVAAGRVGTAEGQLADPAVKVRPVPLTRPIRPAEDLRALFAVRRLLGEHRPAILHSHMAKAGSVGRTAALTLRERPRLVHTFHGHVLRGYFPSRQERLFIAVERRLARFSDALVAVSPEIRDELLDLGIGRPQQYHVIPVGIDLSPFLSVKGRSGQLRGTLGLDESTRLVGVLGRLVPVKDHATLLACLALVPDVHLAVLGDGELREDLALLARQLGLSARVHFVGWWADVPAALADLDVIVLSSRNEGTPVALIEALAAARPVVATDVGGVRHVVQHNETGVLCPPGDAAALGQALQRLLRDKSEGEALGLEGRRRMAGRFGSEQMIEAHRRLYEDLTRRSRQKGQAPVAAASPNAAGEPGCPRNTELYREALGE